MKTAFQMTYIVTMLQPQWTPQSWSSGKHDYHENVHAV